MTATVAHTDAAADDVEGTVSPFEVMLAGDFYDVAHWWGWQFFGTKNHVDGERSFIRAPCQVPTP